MRFKPIGCEVKHTTRALKHNGALKCQEECANNNNNVRGFFFFFTRKNLRLVSMAKV